jgi:hypothetical protein
MSDTTAALGPGSNGKEGASQPEVDPNQLWVNGALMINGAWRPAPLRRGRLSPCFDDPESYGSAIVFRQVGLIIISRSVGSNRARVTDVVVDAIAAVALGADTLSRSLAQTGDRHPGAASGVTASLPGRQRRV